MSNTGTARLINDLKALQKESQTRIRQLEGLLQQATGRQEAAVRAAVAEAEAGFGLRLEQLQRELRLQQEERVRFTAEADEQCAAQAAQLAALQQELAGVRTVLAAADAENAQQRDALEALGQRLDATAEQQAEIVQRQAEIAKAREDLTHILDTVRERLRRREMETERAVLNRAVLNHAAPERNFR
jgi:chromosome segregation ATPase